MATTLSADQEALTFFSFPITKREDTPEVNPVDGTPDLWIWGKATDGTIDGDREIVDPEWSAKALVQWCDTGGNVRMSHDPKRPVGKGHEVHVTAEGHYVRSKICDPLCKHLIRQGVLNDYSVGISNPDFRYGDRKLDPEGKALRVITGKPDGSSRIAELTVCDRGSNFNSRFSVVKSANGFTGQMVGDEDELAKAAPAELVKAAREGVPAPRRSPFSPADLNKLLEHRRVAEERQAAELPAFKAAGDAERRVLGKKSRNFSAERRRELAHGGNALPDGSYPIPDKDALRRAAILARSGHGNVAAARKLIARRAKELGVANPLDSDGKDGADKGMTPAPPATPEAPEVAKDDGGDPKEPVLHHDDGEDDDTDSDADAMDKAATPDVAKPPKAKCPACGKKNKPSAKFCGSCGKPMGGAEKADKPTPGEGVTGAAASDINPVPEHREPDGPAIEALEHDAHLPTVPDASMKTAMRLRELGVPLEHGRLHDLTCPAYGDASVKAAWPGADFTLIDDQLWQAKALEVAATAPLEEAQKASQIWTAARMLKAVTPDLHHDIMEEARKAFRDANPGPGTAPVPGEMRAQRYNRPYITAGHSAPSPGHDAPHRDPVHAGHISASDFTRDLITAGHAADSPDNDPGHPIPVGAPEVPGVPSRVFYTNVQRQNAAQAMRAMHDHIAATFPDLCPMHGPGHMGEQPSHARPVAVGVGGPVPHGASTKADVPVPTPLTGSDPAIPPGLAKRLAKKEGKRRMRELMEAVFKGDKTLNAARAELGLPPFAMPEAGAGMAVKAAGAEVAPPVAKALDADVIKAAVAEATEPLKTELAELRRVTDAIADQPDPGVTAYRGAAITKTTAAPAGPLSVPSRAEHVQDVAYRAMYDQWRNSPDPGLREQALTYLMGASGLIPPPA